MLVAAVLAVGVWAAMGALIVRQKIPAFIITLGGLLVFKGLHWLVIRNQTIPVVAGGEENLYSLLTTYYLPPWAGYRAGRGGDRGVDLGHARRTAAPRSSSGSRSTIARRCS